MRFKLRSVFGVLLGLCVLSPCQLFAASFTVDSVSALDTNPYGLTITSNTNNVSGNPGGTGLSLTQFQTLMQGDNGAFARDNGGVLNAQQVWQGGSFPANAAGNNNGAVMGDTSANPITVTYGDTQANTFQFWRDVGAAVGTIGIDSNVSNGTNVVSGGGQSPSGGGSGIFNFGTGIFNDTSDSGSTGNSVGGGYIGIQGAMPVGLVFNNPAVGTPTSPVSNITAFGITQVPRGSARSFEIVATFSDTTTFDTGLISYTATGADFVGIQAPSGQTITRIDILDPNASGLTRFDDMAFITNAPADADGWKLTSGASWNSTGSWATGVIPNAQGASASFRDALTTSGNIALDGSKTVGQVVFDNPNASYTITPGSGGSLTINNTGGSGTPAISVSGGNHAIGAPIILANASTQLYVDLNTSLTLSGNVSDTGSSSGITKVGAGTVLLSGNNSYGGTTTVNLGTLDVSKPSALPGYNAAGKIIVNAGGTLAVSVGGAGQWASIDVDTLLANATFAVHQPITPSRLGFDTTGGDFSYASNIGGTEGIDKIGNNTLVLSGANTYTGPTRILGGTLSIASISGNLGVPVGAAGDFYSGVISMGSGANGATLKYTGTGETAVRIIDMTGTTGGATLDQSGTGNLVFGTSSGFTLATSRASVTSSGAGNKTLTLQGSTSGTGEIDGLILDHQTNAGTFSPAAKTSVLKTGTGTWTLTGVNNVAPIAQTYSGTTTINQGTLALGNAHVIDTTSGVVLGGGRFATGGFDQFVYGTSTTTLSLNSNSVLDLGVGGPSSGTISFANSAGLWQTGTTLTVDDWVNGKDHLFFGTDATGLTNSGANTGQLAQINFVGFGPGAQITSSGEVEPLNPGSILMSKDVNGDGHYDAKDILALEQALANMSFFKTHYGPGNLTLNDDEALTVLDQNGDGVVNNADLQALLDNLINGQGSTSGVPEPTTFLLLIIGAGPVLQHYRRRFV